MLDYVLRRIFSDEPGDSEDAKNSKVRDGIWTKGKIWIKAEDVCRLIDSEVYYTWVAELKAECRTAIDSYCNLLLAGGEYASHT